MIPYRYRRGEIKCYRKEENEIGKRKKRLLVFRRQSVTLLIAFWQRDNKKKTNKIKRKLLASPTKVKNKID